MKFQIFPFFLLFTALLGKAKADDRLYFYIECSPGQQCIDLAYETGKTASVAATPAQVLGRGDLKSAKVQMAGAAPQAIKKLDKEAGQKFDVNLGLTIELSEEASKKFERMTGQNIGRKLMVVFDNRILTAPTINQAVTGRMLLISGGRGPFWEKAPWLQDLIKNSQDSSARSILSYVIIALAVSVTALVIVLLPRMRRTSQSHS